MRLFGLFTNERGTTPFMGFKHMMAVKSSVITELCNSVYSIDEN